jgi:hypothetical protein
MITKCIIHRVTRDRWQAVQASYPILKTQSNIFRIYNHIVFKSSRIISGSNLRRVTTQDFNIRSISTVINHNRKNF